jgi:hypothetical protein
MKKQYVWYQTSLSYVDSSLYRRRPHGAEGPKLNIDYNGKNTRWTLNNQELKSK